MYVKAFIRRS